MRLTRRTRDERGAVVVLTALLTCLVLMLVAALTVDLGNTWARRGQLQTQADNAALFAAQQLPAVTPAARLVAAKAAVHYLACHPVPGQAGGPNADSPIPRDPDGGFACPDRSFDPARTTYDTAAADLITRGHIAFPDPYEITVTTPWAAVEYGFAKVAGVDGSDQRKTATAHVYSPGGMLPMGGSVGCVAAAANATGLLGVGDTLSEMVPLNHWSAGRGASAATDGGVGVAVTWPGTPAVPAGPAVLSVTSAVVSGTNVTVAYNNASGLGGISGVLSLLTSNLLSRGVEVWFGRGSTVVKVPTALSVVGTTPLVPIPASVLGTPGQWHVKVMSPMAVSYSLLGGFTFANRQSTNDVTISIGASGLSGLTDLDNLMSCAKPVLSPRSPAGTDSADLIANIRTGVDHGLAAHPSLVAALSGVTNPATTSVGTLATTLAADPSRFLFDCGTSNTHNVPDTTANAAAHPNCLRVDTSRSWAYELTQGFLTPQGRLSCALPDNCPHGSFNGSEIGLGGQYNDDTLADFISGPDQASVLHDLLFVSLDTMLQPSVPLLTPNQLLDDGVYDSPRFFWAPVLTTLFLPGTTASYPVLTFRPAFITQESPTLGPAQRLLNTLAMELNAELAAVISGGILSLVDGTLLSAVRAATGLDADLSAVLLLLHDPGAATKVERHGLVVDTGLDPDRRLQAVRVMNLNPGALPAVDPDYRGPVTDYVGTGPRVVRLVR